MTNSIGVFDSGLGGLTVAGEVLRRLPDENIIYFADTAHVPYGERPLEEIKGFALGITRFLIERGAKAIVMACNISSAVALEHARELFADIPMIGMIEAGSRAAVASGSRAIGVLATTGTVKSGAYSRTIKRIDPSAEVWEEACPSFVPIVEQGMADTEEAEIAVAKHVEPLVSRGSKTLILGCTHYPFLRMFIARATPGACIVDPAEEAVQDLQKVLAERGLLTGPGEQSEQVFYASGDASGFTRLGSSFLGRQIDRVARAEWGVDLAPDLNNVRL